MSGTGFSPERSARHDRLVKRLVSRLSKLGYEPVELPVDGNRPDVRIRDLDGSTGYVDLKSAYQGHGNFAIKRGTFQTAAQISAQGTPVYIISVHEKRAWVDTPETYGARLLGGPRRPTGNGSNTDWLLARPGGTPFEDFFPSRVPETAHGAPTDEPPSPQPADTDLDAVIAVAFGDDSHPDTFTLPTAKQARMWPDYDPDPDGWTT